MARWNVAPLDKPGNPEDEASQTTDDTFLPSADLGRTKVLSPGPRRKVEERVAPFKRATARKFKHRSGFDGVDRRRLREQKARRVIDSAVEELKRRWAEPDASPTAEAPSAPQGEDQNTETTISAEEVAAVPPSPDTSSTTLETTLATLETSFESGSVVCEPEDGGDCDEHKNEDEDNEGSKERNEEKQEELEGGSKESEGREEGKEGEVAEESEEVGQAEENEENEENEEVGETEGGEGEGGRDTDSTILESNHVSTFGGEGSVPAPNEEPSTVLAGDSIPAPADILASTDAVPAISEAPAVMEAARMAEARQVVEQEQAPIANKESSNVVHGEPAVSTATADTPGAMGDLPGSTTTGALELRKRPSDELAGERKKSEGLEGEEGEEGKESESVGESEEIEGEEENNRDVGSGVAECNQVSASAVEHSVPVPSEGPNTLPAGSSVPVPVNISASTVATAAVTGAPAVTVAAQTAEQGQVVAQEEAPVANEEPTNVAHGEEGTSSAAVDTPEPTGDSPGSTPAHALENRKRPSDEDTTGMRKRIRTIAPSLLIGSWADVTRVHILMLGGGEIASNGVDEPSGGPPTEPETTHSAPASSALSNSSADAPGLLASSDAPASTEPPAQAQMSTSNSPPEAGNPTLESHSALDASATVVSQGHQTVTSTTGQAPTSDYAPESHPALANPAPYLAAYNAGFEAGLNQIAHYHAEQQTHGAQMIGGYGYQQQVGAPLAIEGTVGHGGVWNGGQAPAAPGQAQVATYPSAAEGSVNAPEILDNPIPIQAPVAALLPSPLVPTSGSVRTPIPPLQRGSRLSVPKDKPNPKENPYGVRPPLLRKPLKRTRKTTMALDGANIAYHGRMVWQAALESVFRASFPDRQDTGFVSRCSAPAIPGTWIPRSAEAVAKDTESPATGTPQTTIAEAPSVYAPDIPSGVMPASAPLPFPLDPTPAPALAPVAPPKPSGRVSMIKNKPNPQGRRPYQGVRLRLPRKPLRDTRTAAPVDETSHIAYYGRMGWWAVLRSVLRKSFPEWKETGFVPQFSVPDRPHLWTSHFDDAVEALAAGMQQAAIAEAPSTRVAESAPIAGPSAAEPPMHKEVDTPATAQPNEQHSAEDELVQMFSGAMQSVQNATYSGALEDEVAEYLVAQGLSGPAPGQVEGAEADGDEETVSDSDEEDAEEVEAAIEVELEGGDMAAAEAFLAGMAAEGLFGPAGPGA
ncbi:hypothetical protein FRC07_014819 [Ceratobasidium sp. 392]|nr:hypothetical protein FRC07_014819 [Ceratobasidium sp. 392]